MLRTHKHAVISFAIIGGNLGPAWYSWGLVALALPCAWTAGKLALRHVEGGAQ